MTSSFVSVRSLSKRPERGFAGEVSKKEPISSFCQSYKDTAAKPLRVSDFRVACSARSCTVYSGHSNFCRDELCL